MACNFRQIATSPGSALFSEVAALDVDSRGRVYVGDRDKASVTVLTDRGQVLRSIGRSGAGPGEFKWIRDVQILSGDSLMVYDFGLNRISVFAPASDDPAYVVNLAIKQRVPPNSVTRVVGRNLYVAEVIEPFRASGDDPRRDYEREQVIRLVDVDGSVRRDSVLVLPAGQEVLLGRTARSVTAIPNPFGRPGIVDVSPGGRIYYGRGDSLAIDIYSLEGHRVGGFALSYSPPRITSQDVQNIFASESEAKTLGPAVKEFIDTYAAGRWPAFHTFTVDERGRIWIGLLTLKGGPTQWVAFDDQGRRICSTELPDKVMLKLVRGGYAYAVATDELDVPHVVIYRIEGIAA